MNKTTEKVIKDLYEKISTIEVDKWDSLDVKLFALGYINNYELGLKKEYDKKLYKRIYKWLYRNNFLSKIQKVRDVQLSKLKIICEGVYDYTWGNKRMKDYNNGNEGLESNETDYLINLIKVYAHQHKREENLNVALRNNLL